MFKQKIDYKTTQYANDSEWAYRTAERLCTERPDHVTDDLKKYIEYITKEYEETGAIKHPKSVVAKVEYLLNQRQEKLARIEFAKNDKRDPIDLKMVYIGAPGMWRFEIDGVRIGKLVPHDLVRDIEGVYKSRKG